MRHGALSIRCNPATTQKMKRALKGSSRRATFWTSAATGTVLVVGTLFAEPVRQSWLPGAVDELASEALSALAAGDDVRRLDGDHGDGTTTAAATTVAPTGDMYPDDPLLNKYCCDSDGNLTYGKDKNRWLIVVHCVLIAYMLLGLNTVCDVYFAGALETMVEKWDVKPDVAGATFMAAGGSAPELFTSLIGATIAVNDVGFGTIVGSAVFNVLFVIGLCGYVADEGIKLTWWPLFRDCIYYVFGLGCLAFCASDNKVGLLEAIVLFFLYLIYCFIMYNNQKLEDIAYGKHKRVAPEKDGDEPACPTLLNGKETKSASEVKSDAVVKLAPGQATAAPETTPEVGDAEDDAKKEGEGEDGAGDNDKDPEKGEEEDEAKDDEDEEEFGEFMVKPDGALNQLIWYLSLPIYIPLYYLTPEPTETMFMVTFFESLIWIAGYSFLLVWWVEILGQVLGIGPVVMGFTLLAAGTSIPDLVSSMAVARMGEADMAVSSSIGSNIFDILVGLPIPWIIKIACIEGVDFQVTIGSPYITFYVLLLLFMVIMVICSIIALGWVLNKALGVCMAALYVFFLIVALVVEEGHAPWLSFS
eukprot:TRINITY_DN103186_c0_g1_i1.p1 TRINITY_DN103186_c0_g1~~TRINITY_DN103186_c0_g1_i1.p1  ORF type:complete len:587 (-),score=120.14 TRINITY_DN103186_c0_g1_i1:193-1953(-)